MFYDNFLSLCAKRTVTPSAVMREIGLNKSSASYWKKGSIPSTETLQKLADYFGVSMDYLIGWDAANDRLRDAGLSINDVADEMNVPVEVLQKIIDNNDASSAEALVKLSRIATLLADITERQSSDIVRKTEEDLLKRINRSMSQMTLEGQEKVADYAEDILPRYRAETTPQSTSAPQESNNTTPPPDAPETPSEGE